MEKRKRFLLYLYSTPNIVGCLLGILGLALFFMGIINQFWLLIVIGLYVIGVLATPRSPTYELEIKNQLTADDIREELDGLIRKIKGKVPKEVFDLVQSIKGSIVEVLPQIVDLSGGDYNIYTIKQTALDYLPASLQNYLNLPPAYANLHVVKDGKTSKQLLLEQLNLLDQEMKEVVQAVYANDTQKLMVQGQFLKEKFQKPVAII
ncbi:MAG TPA: hypothetical protein VMS73_09760 [Anaerolineaceae bacterium]|nr:hypothetical protein [Anaerolineaceae bacterium]